MVARYNKESQRRTGHEHLASNAAGFLLPVHTGGISEDVCPVRAEIFSMEYFGSSMLRRARKPFVSSIGCTSARMKLSTRCGLRPWARQMRETEALDMPISLAMVRVDQWVASSSRNSSQFFLNTGSDIWAGLTGCSFCRQLIGKLSFTTNHLNPSPSPCWLSVRG